MLFLTAASLVTSALIATASPPSPTISLAMARANSRRRPTTATCAPSAANNRAAASPMPEVAPLTQATRPFNRLDDSASIAISISTRRKTFPLFLEPWSLQNFGIYHRNRTPAQRNIDDAFACRASDVAEQFICPRDRVRREQHVVEFTEAGWLRHRFFGETIQRRAGDAPFLQRREERVLIHDAAARGVEQVGIGLHQRQFLRTDKAAGFFGERTMDGDEIGLFEQFFQTYQLRAAFCRSFRAGKRIERDRLVHAEAAQQLECLACDAAESNDPERAIAQFAAHVFGAFVPLAGAHEPVLGKHVVAQR